MSIITRPGKIMAVALAALVGSAGSALALDPDDLSIENPDGTENISFKYNAASGDLGLASDECAFQANGIICEGSTADANETRLVFPADPAAERTITFPDATGTVLLSEQQDAGTDVTADLEEEAHASEHASAFIVASGETLVFKDTDTLAGNPALGSEECVFSNDGTGGILICEGATADTSEGLLAWNPTSDQTHTIPDASSDTFVLLAATQTLTNKTLTTPTIGDFSNSTHDHSNNAGGGQVDIDDLSNQATWATAATKITANLTISGVEVDYEGGASEGFPRLAQSTTPPSAECDESGEAGRLYFDTDADTDGSVFVCTGTGGWKDIDDDGGGVAINPDRSVDSEMRVKLAALGKIYMSLSGKLCSTEADCNSPFRTGTLNNLDCLSTVAQTVDEVKVTLGTGTCTTASFTYDGSEASLPAAANTMANGSDASKTGGANTCARIEIENTGASGMANKGYINCSIKQTA